MTIGQSHEVSIGGVEYRLKFGTSSIFEHGYQSPFVERNSVSPSRSEGDYSGDLVFTQSSWAAGEGYKTMRSGGESGYWYSEDVDISGAQAGIQLLKSVSAVSGGASQPDFGTGYVNAEAATTGITVSFPTNTGAGSAKKVWTYNGSTWSEFSSGITGRDAQSLYGMCYLRGYYFLAFEEAIARSDDFTVDWTTENGNRALATDGSLLFVSQSVTVNSVEHTHFYTASPTAAAATALTTVSTDLEGRPQLHGMAEHAGTIYAISYIEGAEITMLYRYSGSAMVPWKALPDGFTGQSISSDGSILYIGGKEKCAEGNYRGQLYYITGSEATESIGVISSFGERDGSTDTTCWSIRPHGKSTYFSWPVYGGIGRYDAVNGGISRSYRQTAVTGESNVTSRIRFFNGTPYFLVVGSGATDTTLYKTSTTEFVSSGQLQTSYADFGLPVSQKLFTKAVVVTPTNLGSGMDIAVSYSLDGDTSTWTELSASLDGETADSDSAANFYKYTLTMPDEGVKAHSMALKFVLTRSTDTLSSPQISYATTVAKPLLNTPGSTTPNDIWKFQVVVAERCRTMAGAVEVGQQGTKMTNLRTLFEAQEPIDLITIADPTTTYRVLLKNLGEVSPSKAVDNGYEATVTVECTKV